LKNTIINSGEFLGQMSDCQLAKKDFCWWSYFLFQFPSQTVRCWF